MIGELKNQRLSQNLTCRPDLLEMEHSFADVTSTTRKKEIKNKKSKSIKHKKITTTTLYDK